MLVSRSNVQRERRVQPGVHMVDRISSQIVKVGLEDNHLVPLHLQVPEIIMSPKATHFDDNVLLFLILGNLASSIPLETLFHS